MLFNTITLVLFFKLRDGDDTTAHLIGRYCGSNLPNGGNIVSNHNAVHLTFSSDHSNVGTGFSLTWNSSEPGIYLFNQWNVGTVNRMHFWNDNLYFSLWRLNFGRNSWSYQFACISRTLSS